jgi:hypothetical protein
LPFVATAMSDETTPDDGVAQIGRSTCFFCQSEGPLERFQIQPERIVGGEE